MSSDWITTKQAAERSRYHPEHVRELVREGRVQAQKFGEVWQVSRASLLIYLRKVEKMGERRGPKKQLAKN